MRLLQGCIAGMDPQKLVNVMVALEDKGHVVKLGDAWLRWKLTVSPRYDIIKAVLIVMRVLLHDDDWDRIKYGMVRDFPKREALKNALVEAEKGSRSRRVARRIEPTRAAQGDGKGRWNLDGF
jgi:hypothetical protein